MENRKWKNFIENIKKNIVSKNIFNIVKTLKECNPKNYVQTR